MWNEPMEDEEGEHFMGTEEIKRVTVTRHVCGPQCVDGKEDSHAWDGPVIKFDRGESATCSRCGQSAIDVCMWY